MIVGVSGAGGRMGSLVASTVAGTDGLQLGPLFDPNHVGRIVEGRAIGGEGDAMGAADVVVEFTEPGVVMGNLSIWRRHGIHAVVGTSGFDAERIVALETLWGAGPPNCLVVPNFSIGAVVMMHLAELAAPHFAAAEIIEAHHDRKADAPSGTATATAQRIGGAAEQHRDVESTELVPGARGAIVAGVPVHSVRLAGVIAQQQVVFGGPGETLTIRHDTTDRSSFMPGVLAAVRAVASLDRPVTVGLEPVLGLGD